MTDQGYYSIVAGDHQVNALIRHKAIRVNQNSVRLSIGSRQLKAEHITPPSPQPATHSIDQRIQTNNVALRRTDEYIALTCEGHITRDLALSLQTSFDKEHPIQAMVVVFGKLTMSQNGYIVIRWHGSAPQTFLKKLDNIRTIYNFIPFPAGPLDTCITPW